MRPFFLAFALLVSLVSLILLFGISLGIILALGGGPSEKRWSESIDVNLGFLIVDDESSSPIGEAILQLIDPFERRLKPAKTDDRGFANLENGFEASGVEMSRGRTGRISFEGYLLKVSADGYVPFLAPLANTVVDSIEFQAPPPPRQKIRLLKVGTERAKAAPTPELFTRRDEWARRISLLLYRDEYYAVMDASLHVLKFEAESGRLSSKSGVLKLTVERVKKIATRNDENDNWHLDYLTRVSWGGRLYLVAKEQWLSFCNAINQGKEPRSNDYGDFFLRSGDERKSVTGLPVIPAPWDGYFLEEPIRAEVVKVLPFRKASINIGSASGLKKGMELVPSREYLFSEQVVESVEDNSAVIRTKYPEGLYRKIKVGDIVVSRRPGAR